MGHRQVNKEGHYSHPQGPPTNLWVGKFCVCASYVVTDTNTDSLNFLLILDINRVLILLLYCKLIRDIIHLIVIIKCQ